MRSFFCSLILLSILTLQASAGSFDTVVIDAGHGGRDNGGSYGKVYEKWLALDTAIRVEKKLKAQGFRTVMTRRSDNFITLSVILSPIVYTHNDKSVCHSLFFCKYLIYLLVI